MTKSSDTEHCEADTIKDADQCINSQYNLTQSGDYTDYSDSLADHRSYTVAGRRAWTNYCQPPLTPPTPWRSV